MATEIVTTQRPNRRDHEGDYRDSVVGIPYHGSVSAFIAFSIMTAFPSRTPTWQELSGRFGMNRATAYRYLASLKAVRGEF